MTISRRLASGDKRCLGTLACDHPTFAGLSRLCCCHQCDMGDNALSNLAIFDCQTSGQLIPRPCYAPSIRAHVQAVRGPHSWTCRIARTTTANVYGPRLALRDSVVEDRFAVRRFAASRKPLRALPNLPEPPRDVNKNFCGMLQVIENKRKINHLTRYRFSDLIIRNRKSGE